VTEAEPQFAAASYSQPDVTEISVGADGRRIAVMARSGAEPTVVWLGGFRSDMASTKAEHLDRWAAARGRSFIRFDYSGHGISGGRFEDGTLSRWLEDSLAVLAGAGERPVLVGSSMGGWLAVLAARALRANGQGLTGLVLIAPAVDFTQTLMWAAMPEEARRAVMETGAWQRPSAYSAEPYAITRDLIEDGRRHLLLDGPPLVLGCPIHILQGMQDPDVPWQHAMRLVEHLPGDDVVTTLIRDGDHRLSRPQDLDRLVAAVEDMAV
jgi:pimeloyl-ACP methyl ester carboxylesterase